MYPLIIDGGLSNVLEDFGYNLNHKLWTAHLLANNPDAIIQAHIEYIKAGASCITTASYQASTLGLMENGHSNISAQNLIKQSVLLAETAIQKSLDMGIIHNRTLIAGSVGPYGAYLSDGSEYRGNYNISNCRLRDFHLKRIEILDQSHADLLACETIPSFQEAKVLSKMLEKTQKPSWVSFSCKDETYLHDGSKIKECVTIFKHHPTVFAIGVNCTHPSFISEIILTIKEANINKKIIIYPNSGETYNAKTKTWMGILQPSNFTEMVKEWLELGADIIGGCCRIGPKNIKNLQHYINNRYIT